MTGRSRGPAARALIGRATDLARVRALLVDEGVRLLSLVGPGGVGKTRLALAAADLVHDQFADGTYFIDLAPVHDAALVLPTLAQRLGVSETAPHGALAALQAALGARRLLLILDNFEQVANAALALGELLAACPGLHLLVTSREPLALAWEQLFEVGPLDCPASEVADLEAIAAAPAVALFVEHARAVRPHFALDASNARVVVEICRRLDGLPLAIELAAARTRLLSPEAIVVQLRQRPLAVLTGGARDAPTRHRTLREAIAWSYALLEPAHQALFRQVSVFVGGSTLAGIQAVYGGADLASGLDSLLDKHLLAPSDASDADLRYHQLETIRQFGAEQLRASGEADDLAARHAQYLVGVVDELAPALYGASQRASSQRLLAEHNNIRAALDWCASSDDRDRIELGCYLAGSLWLFWRLRGFVGEGRARLAALLARAGVKLTLQGVDLDGAQPSASLARALYAAGYLAFAQAAAADAQVLLSASLDVARQVDDRWTQSYALHGLGHAALLRGDLAEARALYGQRLAIAQKQHDAYGLGQVLNALGEVARCLDEPSVAHTYYARSLELRRRLGDTRGEAMGLANLGHVLVAEGQLPQARAVLTEALALLEELGHQYGQAVCVSALAALAAAEGQAALSAQLLGAASAALERIGNALEPPDLRAYDRTLARARGALRDGFDAEFARGRELSLEQAAVLGPKAQQPPAARAPAALASEVRMLSPREREVVRLIARGCTSEVIAQTLVITRRTADTHAAHVRDKLGLRSRAEIAAWGIRHGLA